MSSTSVPANPTAHNVAALLPKLTDPDSDIRYMTLNDLNQMLINGHPAFINHDYSVCSKVVDGILLTLNDSHGDVQNMAIRCLGPFVNKAPESILCPTIEKVSTVRTSNSVDTAVPALATRAIVVALPHPLPGVARSQKVLEAYSAISRALIPRLVGRTVVAVPGSKNLLSSKGMLEDDLQTGEDSNSLDLLVEVARCYGPMLQDAEVEALEQVSLQILESPKCGSALKKKAVAAIAALAPYFNNALLSNFVSYIIEQLRNVHLTSQNRRLYIMLFGSLGRSIPQKFGPYLKTLTPFIVAPLSQQELEDQREAEIEADGDRDVELEEVREAALAAIETFLEFCAQEMKAFTSDVVSSALRFIKYEPNVADDGEDEDMEDEAEDDAFEGEEDFEEETGFEDEDDVSWKVRRCSAKVLHALVASLDVNDPVVYGQLVPALITRLKEQEESVRAEVIATLSYIILKTGHSSDAAQQLEKSAHPPSRKRRRGFSDTLAEELRPRFGTANGYASPSTPPPVDSATQGLAKINPDVVRASVKLLQTSTPATKQAIISLLKDMVTAQHGGLSNEASLIVQPVVDALAGNVSSMSTVAANALHVEALALLRVIAETHSSRVIQPYLPQITPALVKAAKDRFTKVATEAFASIESYIKALTPPRSSSSKGQNADVLSQLHQVIVDRISASDTDTEVRQKAVQALGLLIGRASGTAGASLLSQKDRFAGQQLISERLKNELTRLSCVRAIDTIAVLAQSKKDYQPDFIGVVALELGAQLRKASRSLRGASLSALRMLAINQASREMLDEQVVAELIKMLVPLLESQDLHMMGPALVVLAAFAKDKPQLVATDEVNAGICSIVRSPLSAAAAEALMTCVEAIGKAGVGKPLMTALLQNAPEGDADVEGQVIGTLLVSGGDSVGVSPDAFIQELKTAKGKGDEAKKCLALAILGEVGLRTATQSTLHPETFMAHFSSYSEKIKLAAAVALGRAGAGNVSVYLPEILTGLTKGKQYLLLHSVKELLQHSNAEDEIRPYTKELWENIINSGQAEANKVVGAECIGRLAIVDPPAYLPQLQAFLQNPSPAIRGMVISALRYVFSDTDSSYNNNLQATMIPMLTTMLADRDLDSQRLALATFNSALHNKPDLVLPHLSELVSYPLKASEIRPELIHEVSMGPFKHKVDAGLEMRKAAYETLYALLDERASRARVHLPDFLDRILAGISDEHEIKLLCCLVLGKLLLLEPAEVVKRLDTLVQQFRAVMAFRPKETAVKQELEKDSDEKKAVVKIAVLLHKVLADEAVENRAWKEWWDGVRKDFPAVVKSVEDESRAGER